MSLCTPWFDDPDDLCAPCAGDLGQDIVDKWAMVASAVLYGLTGRQFPGVCSDVVWPNVGSGCGQWLAYPDGSSRQITGGCSDLRFGAGACAHASILLPHRPVRRIVAVTIDGEVVPSDQYRLRDRRWLVRCEGSWPSQSVCDDFTVEYEYGIPAPAGGRWAAATYACQLQMACDCDEGCRLPKRAQTIVQEGITTAVLLGDPMQLAEAGLTGITEVDQWIRSVNPNGLDRAGKVLSTRPQQTSRLR